MSSYRVTDRQGRTLGASDFLLGLGTLSHRAVIRDGPSIDRVELYDDFTRGVLLDLLRGLVDENLIECAPYRFLRLPQLPLTLTVLECKSGLSEFLDPGTLAFQSIFPISPRACHK